jgi:hypothetical protein
MLLAPDLRDAAYSIIRPMRDQKFYWWFGLAAFGVIAVLAILFWALFSIVKSVNQGVDTFQKTTEDTIGPVSNLTSNVATEVANFLNPTPTILPNPETIIQNVRTLARLETIQYSVEKVISAESRQGPLGFLFGDRLLLVAHGEVIAGVDLSKLTVDDIRLEGDAVHIQLPQPEIFIATLNNDKTYVYDRNVGILTSGNIDLESDARQAAEDEIEQAALEDGILEQAQQNAEVYLERLLGDLGYSDVVFEETSPLVTPIATP